MDKHIKKLPGQSLYYIELEEGVLPPEPLRGRFTTSALASTFLARHRELQFPETAAPKKRTSKTKRTTGEVNGRP